MSAVGVGAKKLIVPLRQILHQLQTEQLPYSTKLVGTLAKRISMAKKQIKHCGRKAGGVGEGKGSFMLL